MASASTSCCSFGYWSGSKHRGSRGLQVSGLDLALMVSHLNARSFLSIGSAMFGSKQSRISLVFGLPSGKFIRPRLNALVVRNSYPQNADFPKYYSKQEKKPFPVPVLELRRAARERQKKAKGRPQRPMSSPKNGLLVRSLIPVAYDVYNARISLLNNLKRLIKVVTVHACRECSEIHVGPEGHPFRSCRGQGATRRKGIHNWTKASSIDEIFVPVEAYHLYDRLGKRITHAERFTIPRIPAIVELCIQAGVDLPDFPTKRRRKPVIRIGRKEIIDANEDDFPDPSPSKGRPLLTEIMDSEIVLPSDAAEIALLAEAALQSWETLRDGAEKLMRKYSVRVCGYCPEIHVGPTGHKAQICGAYKHQQRNGQHGWQSAILDDLIPPRFVWHVPDVNGPPLQRELKTFYGQAPVVVEMCMQAGAVIPEKYKSTMRLNIGIPSSIIEAEKVV